MGEAKFTEGKWWVNDKKVVMCETGRVSYAYSGHDIPYVQDINANAHLIAAAPEMYEMLNKIAKATVYDKSYEAAKPIFDLLAKARGDL